MDGQTWATLAVGAASAVALFLEMNRRSVNRIEDSVKGLRMCLENKIDAMTEKMEERDQDLHGRISGVKDGLHECEKEWRGEVFVMGKAVARLEEWRKYEAKRTNTGG